ncbi:MAG: hypothetical protein ACRD29_19695 [Acidimicrobiales bacterium]
MEPATEKALAIIAAYLHAGEAIRRGSERDGEQLLTVFNDLVREASDGNEEVGRTIAALTDVALGAFRVLAERSGQDPLEYFRRFAEQTALDEDTDTS